MKIFGHEWVDSERFYEVKEQSEIGKTPANALLKLASLNESLTLAKYCQENGLRYAVEVQNIEEAIFANILGATYLLSSKKWQKSLCQLLKTIFLIRRC